MIALFLALILLPLFPLSMLFNAGLQALPVWLRAPVLVTFPIAGVLLLDRAAVPPEQYIAPLQLLAAFTALLYAWRLLAVQEVFIWARLQATSAWPLVWLAWLHGLHGKTLVFVALAVTIPAGILSKVTSTKIRYQGPVKAPIAKGQHIADLVVTTTEGEQVTPLVAAEAVGEAGFFTRAWIGFKQLLGMA